MNLPDTLKHKLGPLAVWQWLGLITVAALAYLSFRKKPASSGAGATTPTGTPPVVVNSFSPPFGNGAGGSPGGGGAVGSTVAPPAGPTTSSPSPAAAPLITLPASTGSVSPAVARTAWPATATAAITTPAAAQPGTYRLAGNYIDETYTGDDGKVYTEQIPATQGNITALSKQGMRAA